MPQLQAYTSAAAPPDSATIQVRPKLLSWTARVWRATPDQAIPLVKIETRLEPREVENQALAEALRPFATALQRLTLYLVSGDQSPPIRDWAVGRCEIFPDKAFVFFRDFLTAPNAQLMLNLLPSAGAQSEFVISLVPLAIERERLTFGVSDYDFGIHNRIG